MSARPITLGLAGIVLCALVGCSSSEPVQPQESTAPTPVASEAAESVSQFTDTELAGVFSDLQFVPDQFANTGELVDSISPGLTATDPSCLTTFGVGWDRDAALSDGPLEFGTSTDRSMTAVVQSTGDVGLASSLIAESKDAIARCGATTDLFQLQGTPVQTQIAEADIALTGTDEALSWRVTGDVGGTPFTLVGVTARVGGNIIALVGWDSATNESYVPLAAQMFLDKL